jgi:hypothetical protein
VAELFEDAEFDPVVVREWVMKGLTSRDTREIGSWLAESDPGNQLLRAFREYFREGVDSSLRGF